MAGDAPCVVGDPLEVHLVLWRPSYQYLTGNEHYLGFAQIIFEHCEPMSQHAYFFTGGVMTKNLQDTVKHPAST